MSVTATVVDSVGVRAVHQVQSVLVTPADIERGYVDVPVGSRIQVRNAGPCALELRADGSFFRSVRVTGAGGAAAMGPTGGRWVERSCGTHAPANLDLSYRFELENGVRPGIYRWPVSITVLPL